MKAKLKLALSVALACVFLSGCSSSQKKKSDDSLGDGLMKKWSYSGDKGPETWHEISESFKICKWGTMQSPINLKWRRPMTRNYIKFDYHPSPTAFTNTGNGFEVWFRTGNDSTAKGIKYQLKRISFHSPSEHTLSGRRFPMEIQFEHWGEDGRRLMLGVLVKKGAWHAELSKVWKNLATAKRAPAAMPGKIQPRNLLPGLRSHYNYMGSLTRPPCTENAEWVVFNTPIQASPEQIQTLRKYYHKNIRPLQPLNERNITNH